VPLRKSWSRLKKVEEEELREATKQRFGYYTHDWQAPAALKVLERNDGMVIAGTGKGRTESFAPLDLASNRTFRNLWSLNHCIAHESTGG